MEIYNLQNKLEYLDEVARLEYEEWAKNKEKNKKKRIKKRKEKSTICFQINYFANWY